MRPEGEIRPAVADGSSPGRGQDITLETVVEFVFRHARLLLLVPFLAAVAALAYSLMTPRNYTASAAFMPQSSSSAGGLLGAAAELGIAVPGERSTESPAFYAALLQSRQLLTEAAGTSYEVSVSGQRVTGTIADFYKLKGSGAPRQTEATNRLRDALGVRTTRETGIVHVTVQTRWPDLSQDVLTRLLELVNEFNLGRRQTQASAERRFVESQLAEARDSLERAESQLQLFLTRNRQFRNSADLTFDYERLNREVERRHRVVGSLSEAFEQARVDEVRNTPVITVLDPPALPIKPDARGTSVRIIGAGLAGLLLALALAVSMDAARSLGLSRFRTSGRRGGSRGTRGKDIQTEASMRRQVGAGPLADDERF